MRTALRALGVAAFHPGRGYWPFGRRPPGRDGNGGPRADGWAAGASANVRLSPDFVRFTPSNGHSGQDWECLKLTHADILSIMRFSRWVANGQLWRGAAIRS